MPSDEEGAAVVELVSVGPQSDFQQAMMASRNAAYSRLQRLGRALSVLLDNRGPSWTRPQCPPQGLPACLHHNVLADSKTPYGIWDQGRGSTEIFQVQEKEIKSGRAGGTLALGQAWAHSGSTCDSLRHIVFTVFSQFKFMGNPGCE